jgi:hypothetical protein
MPLTCKSTFVGRLFGDSLCDPVCTSQAKKSAETGGAGTICGELETTTLVDRTFHVLPRNPHGDTFHEESRGS